MVCCCARCAGSPQASCVTGGGEGPFGGGAQSRAAALGLLGGLSTLMHSAVTYSSIPGLQDWGIRTSVDVLPLYFPAWDGPTTRDAMNIDNLAGTLAGFAGLPNK